jgi:pyruvate/2-oxoglutarate dehydrogenase complex dihydrolipoamide dehydrogenase (E3) component/signal transduction histidine kinase
MAETLTPDICVIGAGAGGLSVAAAAAAFGVSVVLVEKDRLGGECLYTGCVPSKALIAAAKRAHGIAGAETFGIAAGPVRVDFAKVHRHVQDVIAAIAPNDSKERFTGLGVRVIAAAARFKDRDTVVAGDGTEIAARRFVIATGSSPSLPPIPGLDAVPYLTNETVFDLAARPEHLIVIGAGPIGLELAQAFRRLGAAVTVLEAAAPLAREDGECADVVLDALAREGVDIRSHVAIVRVEAAAAKLNVLIRAGDGEETIAGSHLLVATGRTASTEGLGLEQAGIACDRRGIVVDAGLKTTNKRVYAIGDVGGHGQFTHLANYQAGLVIRNALFRLPAKMNEDIVPRVTFTDPELAQVGLTETQAKARGIPIRVLRWPYHENDRAQAEGTTAGHIKAVTDRRGRVLGATIVGAGAGELIATWALAVTERSNIRTFLGVIIPYPTLGGDWKTRRHYIFHTRFDQPMGAAHHRLAAPLGLSRGARINDHMNEGPAAADKPSRTRPHLGLSGKLLVLTLLFVMIAEVLIYVPSVANFRLNWLNDRLSAAYTAALVFETAPDGMVPGQRGPPDPGEHPRPRGGGEDGPAAPLLASSEVPPAISHVIDMRDMPWHRAIFDAFETLICVDSDVMRVVGPAPMGEFVEIVLDEAPLRKAMVEFSIRILLLSLLISAITAALVYLALHVLLVRPMRRMTANMVAFRADPENPGRIIAASDRLDEIGTAERELAAMQLNIATMLQQKNHLAALGLAVSKINHDLRNLLSSAQLFSERLAKISDPHVQRFAPKLMRSLERAIAFCQSTLSYGRVQEPPPDRRSIAFEPLVEDVRETLGLDPGGAPVRWISAVERGLEVDADPDQLFRILLNLVRNALQALESRDARDPGRDQIRITGRREGAVAVIEVSDTGPGLSDRARAHLFEAFQGSTRTGSVGLGLAIVAELVRAHGGDIRLVEGTIGATFRVSIPDRAVDINTRRGERTRATATDRV